MEKSNRKQKKIEIPVVEKKTKSRHEPNESIVTVAESGVVLTGTMAEAFEARILNSVRKLFNILFVLLMVMFVLLFGFSIFLTRLNISIDETHDIVDVATNPAAQEKQAQVVRDLLDTMNCTDQRNLQRAIDELVPNSKSIVEEHCLDEDPIISTPTSKPDPNETTTTTSTTARTTTTRKRTSNTTTRRSSTTTGSTSPTTTTSTTCETIVDGVCSP